MGASRHCTQKVLSNYTRASGRSFGTYIDQVIRPLTELFLHLKKRSAFINITLGFSTNSRPGILGASAAVCGGASIHAVTAQRRREVSRLK
jgi:hypothetical protein